MITAWSRPDGQLPAVYSKTIHYEVTSSRQQAGGRGEMEITAAGIAAMKAVR